MPHLYERPCERCHVAETSIAAETVDVLNKVHASTRLGRMASAPGDDPAAIPPDMSPDEVFQYLLLEVHALEATVVRLANEVGRLNAAKTS